MTVRCYCPNSFDATEVELTGAEAHHLLHVLRAAPGQQVSLFDGRGGEACGEVASHTRRSVQVRILQRWSVPASMGVSVVLGTAVPKGDRFRWLVEKATELGVNRLIPLKTVHSVALPGAGKLAKLQQTVVAASKQCGRSRLMQIEECQSWDHFVAEEFPGRRAYVAHPGVTPMDRSVIAASITGGHSIVLSVGPEGGFTDEEINQAVRAGGSLIGLGNLVLRIETAAIALAAIACFAVNGRTP